MEGREDKVLGGFWREDNNLGGRTILWEGGQYKYDDSKDMIRI